MISCLCCSLFTPFLAKKALSQEIPIAVRGELQKELSLSLADLKAMPPFLIRDVPVIPERVRDRQDKEKVAQTTFRGVLLRDVLWKAGLNGLSRCRLPQVMAAPIESSKKGFGKFIQGRRNDL